MKWRSFLRTEKSPAAPRSGQQDDSPSNPAQLVQALASCYARLVELVVEYGPSLRLPHSRAFGEGLFELRPHGRAGIGRAFYCFLVGKRVTVLHALIKKTPQTPDRELKLARKRLKELQNG